MGSGRMGLAAGALALFAATGSPRTQDCAKVQTQIDMDICAAQGRAAADEALTRRRTVEMKRQLACARDEAGC